MSTLPRCVSTGTDLPIYYMRTNAEDVTGLRYVPFLPAGAGWRWADDAEVESPHIVLTQTVVAELLFVAHGEPQHMTDADAIEAIDRVLSERHCDLASCVAVVAADYGEAPVTAAARMSRCLIVAARLTGVTA